MGIYTKLLREDNTILPNNTELSIVGLNLESVVYNEYLINMNLLENCSNEDERKYLEEKTNILLEVSLKDVKDKIIKAIEMIKEKIKKLIAKIKEFFKNKKLDKALKDLETAKKKIDELDKENEKLKEKLLQAIKNPIVYFDINKYLDNKKTKRIRDYFKYEIKDMEKAMENYRNDNEAKIDLKDMEENFTFDDSIVLTKYVIDNIDTKKLEKMSISIL